MDLAQLVVREEGLERRPAYTRAVEEGEGEIHASIVYGAYDLRSSSMRWELFT